MSQNPGRESDKFMLRFPDGMRDEIRQSAEMFGRSMNSEIIFRLKNYLNRTEKPDFSVSLSEDAFHYASTEASLNDIPIDEYISGIVSKRYDDPKYKNAMDALAEKQVNILDLGVENYEIKQMLHTDFILYYNKTVQMKSFLELLLSFKFEEMPDSILMMANDLKRLTDAEIDTLRTRYEDGLFIVKQNKHARSIEEEINTNGK